VARIKPLDEMTIPEGSRETWAPLHKKFGKVPNLFATFAHSPAAFLGLHRVLVGARPRQAER